LPAFGAVSTYSGVLACITPKDSSIVKEGELLKIGKKTQMMMVRYYILRDHALYIYQSREQRIPSNIISLRGLYINQIKEDTRNGVFGFSLQHDNK
jgi:hypothetical protein